jgi:hypothetical protein
MAKAACLNFALCLLAVAWLTVPQSAFAEEAHAKSDHQAVPEGKGEAAKEDHGSKSDHGKGGVDPARWQCPPTQSRRVRSRRHAY